MSLVAIGSTLRFASIKLINQNECKLTMNLMKARQMSLAAPATFNSSSTNYHGNITINNGALLAVNRCKSRGMGSHSGVFGEMMSGKKRHLSTYEITKNILLVSGDKINAETDGKTLR